MEKTKKRCPGHVEVCWLFGGVNRQESNVSNARTVVFYLLVMMLSSV